MKDNHSNSRRLIVNLAAFVALVALLWGNSIAPLDADGAPPPTPPPVLLPIVQRSAEWLPVGDIPPGVSLFYEVAVCGPYSLAGANNGLYSIKDISTKGVTWKREGELGGGIDQVVSGVTFVPNTDCGTAYAASRAQGIWRGLRTGDEWGWQRVDQGLDQAFVVLVNDDTLFVGGNFGVRWALPLPTNNSATWNETDIPTTTYGLSTSQEDADDIHAAVWQHGIFEKSSDNSRWALIGTIPNPNVYDAATNASGIIVAGTDRGLMRFQDSSWAASHSLTSFAVLAVDERLYASHDGDGVLYSRNGGATWEWMSTGLPITDASFRVRGLSLSDDSRLFASTRAGIWMWTGQP